ncbi:MAG: succinate dehydrogenase iron-sulfur subunit [bacterium]|nr:MAG: succinate dehydrogenase iron-sulfur subunit [bacterium]
MATKFLISRYDSQRDAKPHFQEYQFDIPQGATLLDCLNLIKWTQDGSLALRMSCRSAICGSCAVKVNGHAMLACKTQAKDVVIDNSVTIEPLGNMPVIKDLVVDLEPFWSSLQKIDPWLKPDESIKYEKERLQSAADYKKIEDASTCILCASCYSDCNSLEVNEKYLGPATLAKAQRFVHDTRDNDTMGRLDYLNRLNGVWDCTHCAECSTRCPTDAKPLSRITEIKNATMTRKIHSNSGARHVLGFRESVGGFKSLGIGGGGMLNENYLPPRSVGFFNISGLLSLIPVAVRMFIRRKNPPLMPHVIDKVSEVRKMFRRWEDYLK